MTRMNRIIEIHEADSDLVCQPGIGWMEINETLKGKEIPLFFPLDPGPGATIGGMIGTGCSGTNAVRYGTAKAEWFLNVTVVLPNGEVIKTRRRSRKSSAGFDTTKLFIGAEGTLGIVTEATIRLAPVLPTTVAIVQFPDVQKATEAAREIVNHGVGIQCVELCDNDFMRSTNLYGMSQRKYPEKDSLFFKFQGHSQQALKDTGNVVKTISKKHGATWFHLAENEREAADLWADRKNALYSGLALLEGCKGWSTDVCVPVSKLPELVLETKKDLQSLGVKSTIVGHVGDGNFHALLLFRTEEEFEVARIAVHRMVERAIALDGTCAFFLSDPLPVFLEKFYCRYRRTWCWFREKRISLRRARRRDSESDETGQAHAGPVRPFQSRKALSGPSTFPREGYGHTRDCAYRR